MKRAIPLTPKKQEGFTIIEQIIGSAILSIALVVVNTGFVNILRLYYRTVNLSRVQETVRSISDDLGDAVRYNNSNIIITTFPSPITPEIPDTAGTDTGYMCVGKIRYTYAIDRQLRSSPAPAPTKEKKHVLWVDEPPVCDSVADLNLDTPSANGQELLKENMRLTRFQLTHPGADTYRIDIGVALGDDDLLTVSSNGLTKNCLQNGESHGEEFCATSNLSTVINTRLE